MWDLTMDSEVSKFDLLEHMKRTIIHVKQKGMDYLPYTVNYISVIYFNDIVSIKL